ncbi:DUF6305 family protein [Aminivibrio sp.]|uniref:DUF6305 family protein n=1 Tax=Aminivibrio sp. TaxID=1872489 RepID=UPI001A3EDE6B|nr:DUF6305 family protein [Aminivibrio sp.]MBL3539438.1 hypothetical protein [Aminivibrio sp.]MDK2957993.1 hypothetical protein [Synergistaceae bacterium]
MKRMIIALTALLVLSAAGAAFAADVVLTSAGQSPDVMMVRVVLRKMKIDADSEPLLKADALAGWKVLVAVVGGSSKGLGAAGINKDQEVERVTSLLKAAKDQGVKVLVMHIGGEGRRGTLSDAFIETAVPWGDRIIVVDGGNKDGIFEKLTEGKNVKILTAPNVNGISVPLGETLSEWGISAR